MNNVIFVEKNWLCVCLISFCVMVSIFDNDYKENIWEILGMRLKENIDLEIDLIGFWWVN